MTCRSEIEVNVAHHRSWTMRDAAREVGSSDKCGEESSRFASAVTISLFSLIQGPVDSSVDNIALEAD